MSPSQGQKARARAVNAVSAEFDSVRTVAVALKKDTTEQKSCNNNNIKSQPLSSIMGI
jgi:hypothetical protein